jgi:O-antigen/teichoic acid export membrane protein
MRAAEQLRASCASWWGSHAATLVPSGQSISASVVSLVALAVSGPLVARDLGVAGRGYLALVMVWGFAFAIVGTLGVPAALPYFFGRRWTESGAILGEVLPIAGVQVVLVTVLTFFALGLLTAGKPPSVQLAARLAPAFIPAGIAHQYALAILQARRRFAAFNVFRPLPGALYAAAVLVLFLAGSGQLLAVVGAWVVTTWLAAITAAVVALGGIRVHWRANVGVRGELLRFALRGFVGSFSAIDQLSVDQAVVAVTLPAASVGLYAVASAFSSLPSFVGWGLGTVVYPLVTAQHHREKARRTIRKFVLSVFTLNVLGVALLLVLLPWLVRLFFGGAFLAAVPIARILLVAAVFGASWRVLVEGLRGLGHPLVSSVSEAAMYPLLAVTAPVFILQWGAVGMALALVVSRSFSLGVALLAAFILARRDRGDGARGSREQSVEYTAGSATSMAPSSAVGTMETWA